MVRSAAAGSAAWTPQASRFGRGAHAIPELLGNKSLFTKYECDSCNQMFGTGIENDHGTWSKPMRTIARIVGKKGAPSIKGGRDGQWRIQSTADRLEVLQGRRDSVMQHDRENKLLVFEIPRDPYTPAAVLKSFMKIGLSVLPTDEVTNYSDLLAWVSTPDHKLKFLSDHAIIHTIVPGPRIRNLLSVATFRRKTSDLEVPHITLILHCGNELFQVPMVRAKRDSKLAGKAISMPIWPHPYERTSTFGLVYRNTLDLTSCGLVTDDIARIVLTYGTATQLNHRSSV